MLCLSFAIVFVLKSILSDMNIALSVFLSLPFVEKCFSILLFKVYVCVFSSKVSLLYAAYKRYF